MIFFLNFDLWNIKGTVPTVDLASKYDCAGVVLHAPLMSGMRVAFNTSRTWCCDAFPT